MKTRICLLCSKEFQPLPKAHTQIYCSKKCQAIGHENRRRERDYNPCPNCGTLKHKTSEYCQKCFGQFRLGENNPGWKGGRGKAKGYITVLLPATNTKHARHIVEHRLVWEQIHGPIPEDWQVHHINGVKDDNRLENLIALPPRSHRHSSPVRQQLRAAQSRIRELERLLDTKNHLL